MICVIDIPTNMSFPPFIYRHGIQSLQHAYELFGYDTALKELQMIHHIHQQTAPVPLAASEVVSVPVSNPLPPPPPSEETKNVIIQPKEPIDKKSQEREPLSDELRCTQTISNGQRCCVRRKKSSELCHRHFELAQKSKQ